MWTAGTLWTFSEKSKFCARNAEPYTHILSRLSALNLESVGLDVYRHMREDQIQKNEDSEHRQYRNRELELAQAAENSSYQAPILVSEALRHAI